MENSNPLCKNCKYFAPRWLMFFGAYEFARCDHPKNRKADPVTGKLADIQNHCSTRRIGKMVDDCGEAGKWFEQK